MNVRRSERNKNKDDDKQEIERRLKDTDDYNSGLEVVFIKGKGRGIKVVF